MGQMKHYLEERDRQEAVATSIAIKAGVLERCEFHEDSVYLGGHDVEDAYKLGNSLFTAKKLGNVFSDRREMTDTIQSVVEDTFADSCPDCARWMED